MFLVFFFPRGRRQTRCGRDWSSDVRPSDLGTSAGGSRARGGPTPADESWDLFPAVGTAGSVTPCWWRGGGKSVVEGKTGGVGAPAVCHAVLPGEPEGLVRLDALVACLDCVG